LAESTTEAAHGAASAAGNVAVAVGSVAAGVVVVAGGAALVAVAGVAGLVGGSNAAGEVLEDVGSALGELADSAGRALGDARDDLRGATRAARGHGHHHVEGAAAHVKKGSGRAADAAAVAKAGTLSDKDKADLDDLAQQLSDSLER
jgi:hypothetical protein